jgi:predicted DNA-binding transcriptional regulator AlpA
MPSSPLRIMPEAGTAEPTIDAAPIGEPGPEPPALLMTVDDLARELRTSGKTITRMEQSGRLPRPIKVGRAKRWSRQTIVAWIASGAPSRRDWEAFYEPRLKGRGR